MSNPKNLLIVRHAVSEGNLKDSPEYKQYCIGEKSEEICITDLDWRLAPEGVHQAKTTGEWIANNVGDYFDVQYSSPLARAIETSYYLGLSNQHWVLDRRLRERSAGKRYVDIAKMARELPLNKAIEAVVYGSWNVGGESLVELEERIQSLLMELGSLAVNDNTIIVTHGGTVQGFRSVLEGLSDEEIVESIKINETNEPSNAWVYHYTRIEPETGEESPNYKWMRICKPMSANNPKWAELGSRSIHVSDMPRLFNRTPAIISEPVPETDKSPV